MMSKLMLLFFIAFLCGQAVGQSVPVPPNYSVVDNVPGDLDQDGIAELVVAYNTEKESEDASESVPRELIIYKKEHDGWVIWKRSGQALYGSRDGGMMGDPFEDIQIENGVLSVSQSGGSSWKWGHTDKYRYQDGAFYLIGYSSSYGRICDYWTNVDFNISTGKMIVTKAYEKCDGEEEDQKIYKREDETLYHKGLKIKLENRSEKELVIVTPKYRHEVYITASSD
jgi:hypothetical protein